MCAITNRRVAHYLCNRDRIDDQDVARVVGRMESAIAELLGPYVEFRKTIPERLKVTSGATSNRPRSKAERHMKLTLKPVCTSGAVPYIKALAHALGYVRIKPRVADVNRVEFVPKNWKTFRTIACEAEGCMPFQLAFDDFLKERLRKWGVDLSSQLKNQRMAVEGSISGKFATVDLSMASDCLAYNVVLALLPDDYFH